MKILFISFIDFGEMSSGSSVRPQMMYKAFIELGHEVKLLSGLQNKRKQRKKNVREIIEWLKTNKPDICYIEPPSGPIFNLCDHKLIFKLHKHKIPIGFFYRDAYWKYSDLWNIKGIKNTVIKLMHKFDLWVIKNKCSIVYFPTESMSRLFNLPHKSILPPAGNNLLNESLTTEPNAIYVGAISHWYGTDILLDAFDIINKDSKKLKLTLVCRKSELNKIPDEFLSKNWLEILHLSGEALTALYEKSRISIYAGRKNPYMDFCMPVKIMEYISHGLPIVTTNCNEIARFVSDNNIGIVCNDNPKAMSEAVLSVINDNEKLDELRANVRKCLVENNLWIHRAQKVIDDLTSIKQEG